MVIDNVSQINGSDKKKSSHGVIDLLELLNNKRPIRDFIWPGFRLGTVGALIAPGGVGKSFFALEAAISVSSNLFSSDLLGLNPNKQGKVFYLVTEDLEEDICDRVISIAEHVSKDVYSDMISNLTIKVVTGKTVDLTNKSHLELMLNYCKSARLIVLDTLNCIHTLDENSNRDMSQFMTILKNIAKITGASVLFLHHVNKGSVREGQTDHQQSARGASALIDNSRWCGYLTEMTKHESMRLTDQNNNKPIENHRNSFVKFGVNKQNYGIKPFESWYKRHENGVLLPVKLYRVSNREGILNKENKIKQKEQVNEF